MPTSFRRRRFWRRMEQAILQFDLPKCSPSLKQRRISRAARSWCGSGYFMRQCRAMEKLAIMDDISVLAVLAAFARSSSSRRGKGPISGALICRNSSNSRADGTGPSRSSVSFKACTDMADRRSSEMWEWAIVIFGYVIRKGWWYLSPILRDLWDSTPLCDTFTVQSLL